MLPESAALLPCYFRLFPAVVLDIMTAMYTGCEVVAPTHSTYGCLYDLSGQEVVIMDTAVSGYARSCRYVPLRIR